MAVVANVACASPCLRVMAICVYNNFSKYSYKARSDSVKSNMIRFSCLGNRMDSSCKIEIFLRIMCNLSNSAMYSLSALILGLISTFRNAKMGYSSEMSFYSTNKLYYACVGMYPLYL